ncbi:energy transducer TonB [Tenacibaculum sp. SG-28]|uniref:energy transducer TonB n=1 Tax=Tenacibaculum sp. SG-28 TaxID=754426 RepID=UPI000CF46350|nr:energy transducer TonB [Tenacibaculum sp. SG-28]PQJ19605.1 energy transducer TonB [Tenacibaculum sp. SG-28]
MKYLNTKHKRKSAGLTMLILSLLLVGIFSFGMTYLDPPVEYGVAINFGNSEVGSGAPVKEVKQENTTAMPEEIPEASTAETSENTSEEEVLTNDAQTEAPSVAKPKEEKENNESPEKEVEPAKQPEPKPSQATKNALESLMQGANSEGATAGEGDDIKQGLKGNKEGDINTSNYYGNTRSGSDGNYNLAGRKALSKPKPKDGCQEEGTVVVSIVVDKTGKVIAAEPGGRGSTSADSCLNKAAKEAALNTTWNAVPNASPQKGSIIYVFTLK